MGKKIKFGTDGWRGIIADDFTFDNVRIVAGAIAGYLHDMGKASDGMVIGYDGRFLSDRFAHIIAEIFADTGIPVYKVAHRVPTPLAAYAVTIHNTAGAVMLTASHNPPEYNGIKFIPEYAGPALPEVTVQIEERINRILAGDRGEIGAGAHKRAAILEISPFEKYVEHILSLVDTEAIRKASIRAMVNPFCGAGCGYQEGVLTDAGVEVDAIHNRCDVMFGGYVPEPTGDSLAELSARVVNGGYRLGLALDGDGDRFGVIDGNGNYITPNQFLPLLYDHLIESRGWVGPAIRTVATTHMMDRIAQRHGQSVEETSVGFKYIAQGLLKGCVVGGEESGGLSIKGHIPEKDGLLANLLAVEMVAVHGLSLTELMGRLEEKYGKLYSDRLDIETEPGRKAEVLGLVKELDPPSLAGSEVVGRITVDGTKLVLESGAWVLIRASGTEPLFRIYVEANNPQELKSIQQEVRKLVKL